MKEKDVEIVDNQISTDGICDETKNGSAERTIVSHPQGYGIELKDNAVLNDKDVMALLDVGAATLRKYRDEGYLTYRQIECSDKRWYMGKDIRLFLEAGLREAYR